MIRRSILVALAVAAIAAAGLGGARAAEAPEPPDLDWPHAGLFGTFDRAELQRGFQVYREVCASCHSLRLISFRNLAEIGFGEDEVKAIAAEFSVVDGPDQEGEMFDREARPADRIPPPFANDNAARAANNGALPPDLSLITKAREGGADFIHAILTGYDEPPEDFELADGMSYHHYFAGHQIAMPAPLYDEAVEYADETEASVDRMARDVVTFLAWAAEPELEERKRIGLKVLIFIAVFTALLYAIKVKVWSKLH